MPLCWLWYLLFVQCTRQDLGVTDFGSTLVRVWISNSSGVAATTRMHLSCSLATASAVQRVLDNLFCTSTCCQGLVQESRVWKQNLFAFWTVVCHFAVPKASEMWPLQPVLWEPVFHFLTSPHHLPLAPLSSQIVLSWYLTLVAALPTRQVA